MANQSEMVIIIRPSFKKVCGPDACRAGVYNHILYRLAKKAKNEPEKDVREGNIFWFASAEDICQDIDEAWCVNKVRKEIKQLVDAGLLGQRHNPIKKWDRKYQYFLSEEQGEKLLERCTAEGVCLLHIGLNAEVLHLLHMVNAFNKNGGCICQKEEMELPNMGNASTINGGAIPEGSQPKGSTKGSQPEEEEESNSDDTTKPPVVSSDTAHAEPFFDQCFFCQETMHTRCVLCGKRICEKHSRNMKGDIWCEACVYYFENMQGDSRAASFEAYSFIVPTNYVEALAYLAPHGGVPPGYTDAEVLKLAQKLYAEANEQDEKVFTDEKLQGDDHATLPASGHSHRVGDVAAPGVGHSHHSGHTARLGTPDTRSGLETQEKITEGDTHANCVSPLPAANPAASGERAVSRPGSDHSHRTVSPADGLPAVRPAGSGTPGQEAGRDGRDAAHTLAKTPTTPMPAQSLSPSPQAEQAASGTVQHVDPNRGVTAFQEPVKPNQSEDQKAGKWNAQAMVERACELRGKPFSDTARPKETKAAHKLFTRKPDLTLEEFEKAWKQWDTPWWRETNGLFNLTDLAAVPKNKSEMRLIIALEKLALSKVKQTRPPDENIYGNLKFFDVNTLFNSPSLVQA